MANGEKLSDRVWDLVFKALAPLFILGSGVIIAHEINLSRHDERLNAILNRVTTIEQTRFTNRDGETLELRIRADLEKGPKWLKDDIEQIMIALKESRDVKVTMKEIQERMRDMEEIKAAVKEIQERLRTIERKVQ